MPHAAAPCVIQAAAAKPQIEGSQGEHSTLFLRNSYVPLPSVCQSFFLELQFTKRELFLLRYGNNWDILEGHNFKMKGEKLWD